jgi:DNA polymerase-3 subunit epsilon
MRILFFDTETTGLIHKNPDAEIISYGGVTWDDGELSGKFQVYVLPKHGCPEEVAKVNGYNETMWRQHGAVPWSADNSRELKQRLDGMFMGGSHPACEQDRVRAECRRAGAPVPDWNYKALDVGGLALPLQMAGEVPNCKLVTLAEYFGVPHDAHTALGDAIAAAHVWEALCDRFHFDPQVMRAALLEIADQAATDGDTDLEEFARNASEGIEG